MAGTVAVLRAPASRESGELACSADRLVRASAARPRPCCSAFPSRCGQQAASSAPGAAARRRQHRVRSQQPRAAAARRRRREAAVSNRANELLPPWLRVRGEFRERFEGFENLGFTDGARRHLLLTRFRFNATVTPQQEPVVPGAGAGCARRQARPWAPTDGAVPGAVRPAHGVRGHRRGHGAGGRARRPAGARLRRPAPGRPRQLAERRAHVRCGGGDLPPQGVPARRLRRVGRPHPATDEFDKSGNGNRFAGAYVTTRQARAARPSVEPYVFCRRDVNLRSEIGRVRRCSSRRPSASAPSASCRRGLDYSIEMALQRGSLGTDDCQRLGRPLAAARVAARHAARSSSPANTTSRPATRTPPTARAAPSISSIRPPHDKYGLADQVGWRNIHHVRAGFELTPIKAHADHGELSLVVAGRKDATRSTRPAARARPSSPAARPQPRRSGDRRPGQRGPHAAAAAGRRLRAHLHRRVPEGSHARRVLQPPYVMLTYVFLADK